MPFSQQPMSFFYDDPTPSPTDMTYSPSLKQSTDHLTDETDSYLLFYIIIPIIFLVVASAIGLYARYKRRNNNAVYVGDGINQLGGLMMQQVHTQDHIIMQQQQQLLMLQQQQIQQLQMQQQQQLNMQPQFLTQQQQQQQQQRGWRWY